MSKIIKAVSLLCALCLLCTAFIGCGKTVDFSEEVALITESIEKAIASESGEVLVHESIDAETDIPDLFENGYVETYIIFTKGEELNFRLEKSTVPESVGIASTYEIIKEGDMVYELYDGRGKVVEMTEFPDFFESVRINYKADDVKNVTSEIMGGGVKLYTLAMSDAFANSFDSTEDDIAVDCTSVEYGYYIDSVKNLNKMTVKYTYKVTYEGKTQTVTKLVNSEIA